MPLHWPLMEAMVALSRTYFEFLLRIEIRGSNSFEGAAIGFAGSPIA